MTASPTPRRPLGRREPAAPSGLVVGLYVAGGAGEPVQARPAVDVVAGVGVVGDRYATGTGHWSDPRWPDQQLTLVESEVAEALGVAPERLRRNIVTRGVALGELIGARVRIGSVELHGVRVCDPCAYLEQLTGRAGLARDLGRAGGGLRAAVVGDGRITVGDAVVVVS
jgi:MOSC domain-containing protein YiiM